MRSTVLFAVVLVLNFIGGDGPRAFAGTESAAAPQSTGPPSTTQKVPPPDIQGFPTAPAPDELATVALPDTVSAVTALFERLPAEIAGHARSPQVDRMSPERVSVGYGKRGGGVFPVWLLAIDLTRGNFFPTNWTGGQVVAFMAGRSKEALERSQTTRLEGGRDGDLFWMREETLVDTAGSTAEPLPVYGTLWGRVDSPWMFSVRADSRESGVALLAAFVAAARSAQR